MHFFNVKLFEFWCFSTQNVINVYPITKTLLSFLKVIISAFYRTLADRVPFESKGWRVIIKKITKIDYNCDEAVKCLLNKKVFFIHNICVCLNFTFNLNLLILFAVCPHIQCVIKNKFKFTRTCAVVTQINKHFCWPKRNFFLYIL